MEATEQSSSLFAVFFLSIYTLVLIPYSIYKVCTAAAATSEVVKPWQKVASKARSVADLPQSVIGSQDALGMCRHRSRVGLPSS